MQTLRVLTLNLWGEQPPLEQRMEILVRGLSDLRPDVVALQEVRQIAGKLQNQAEMLAQRAGFSTFAFAPAASWGGGDEGVAILARHPIGEQESTKLPSTTDEPRVALMARVDTPCGPVRCYSTHLNYRMTHGLWREQQIVAVDDFVRAHPSDLPQFLMGDFNASPEHDE